MKKLIISKKDLEQNIDEIRKALQISSKQVKIISVVKANGMGLGLVEYSKFLIDNGIDILAVATIEEAIKLRKSNINTEILMLSPVVEREDIEELISNNIILTIDSIEQIKICEELANDKKVKAHIKIDTGFGRYGFLYTDSTKIIEAMKSCKKIQIIGMYTHFSKAMDAKWTKLQFSRFMHIVEIVKKNGIDTGLLHCCNSTGFLLYKDMWLDAIRIGSAIQGRVLIKNNNFRKIGKFISKVVEIKNVPKGYTISYGNNFKTKRDTQIAIIPVGTIDGLNFKKNRDSFKLSENIISVLIEIKKIFKDNSIKVNINNKEVKIIGRLGMYHAIADITDLDVKIGDEVILDIPPLNVNSEIRREYI